ncbi:hypothetical protein VTN31DRAFT_4904 [Thermomyces dupontii]|uniref:uncharacterized protein n=1 Tax=Talaromyces thermophilus TaxID=28565 RepID=UPI0037423BA4
MSHQEFIQSFEKVPKELFRLITGPSIRIRAKPGPLRPQGSFDLLTYDGKVQPKALNPETYQSPNGASMRPNSKGQQRIVKDFKGDVSVYAIPEGVELPEDLILVHEFGDHYALQPSKEMTVEGNVTHYRA